MIAGSFQQWQKVVSSVPIKKQRGGDIDQMRRIKGLLPNVRQEYALDNVDEYIGLGHEVVLLEWKRFEAMPAGDRQMFVKFVGVRGLSNIISGALETLDKHPEAVYIQSTYRIVLGSSTTRAFSYPRDV